MPLYEYVCDKCEHRFEVIQKFSDELVSTCPERGGTVTKQMSSPAIQFKGTGWYITDYARKPSGGEPSQKSDGARKKDANDVTELVALGQNFSYCIDLLCRMCLERALSSTS